MVLPTFPTISVIFRTMALAHRVSRKSWKLLVLPTFSVRQSWKMLVLPTFPTISVIVRTMALAHGVSRKLWKLLVLPTFSVRQSWKMLVLPTFPTISMIVRTMALAHGVEKTIMFGNGKGWQDVEADEATFDKRNIANVLEFKHLVKSKKGTIMWEQWGGIIQTGRPTSLVLRRLTPKVTVLRAPGPGAIRRVEWKALANEFLCDRKVVLHTDSAKSYRLKVPGVLHDRVVHCKKRVKVQGKWRWQPPHYIRLVKHKLPGSKGKTLTVKSGTQIIDRVWRYLKERVRVNQHTKAGSALLRAKLRSAQYDYWNRNMDMWVATGKLCSHAMTKFLS